MTQRPIQLILLLVVLLSCSTIVVAQSPKSDPLKPFTTCKAPGGLKIKEVTRRANREQFREVTIGKDKQKVSVIDGYRVMFSFPDLLYYFANVKIEQSSAESYEKDKQILIDQLKSYTTIKQATGLVLTDKTLLNGFEHYGIDRDKLDVGDTVGTHVLFYDPKQLVITIYFLNQSKAIFANKRRFETIEQYLELKDVFLRSYSQCLKSTADAQ